MVNQKRGQGLVEFAIVLPFFIVMLMGAFYLIMLCYNVITLSTLARDSARQLSVSSNLTSTYNIIVNDKQPKNGMLNYLYTWDPKADTKAFVYTSTNESNNKSIKVVLKATSNQSASGAFFISKFLPNDIYGESTMYWETAK